MKKKIVASVIMIMCLFSLAGCQKKVECDICGEVKMCTTKNLDGEKLNICKDCQKEIADTFK